MTRKEAKNVGELYTVYCSPCGCCGHAHRTLAAASACRRRHNLQSIRRASYHAAEVRIIRNTREIETFEAPFGPGSPVEASDGGAE